MELKRLALLIENSNLDIPMRIIYRYINADNMAKKKAALSSAQQIDKSLMRKAMTRVYDEYAIDDEEEQGRRLHEDDLRRLKEMAEDCGIDKI